MRRCWWSEACLSSPRTPILPSLRLEESPGRARARFASSKPEPALFQRALASTGGERPLVVGDRLDTDIAGAGRLGWDSVLVLTGAARRADVDGVSWEPTFIVDDVGGLLKDPAHGGEGILPGEVPNHTGGFARW